MATSAQSQFPPSCQTQPPQKLFLLPLRRRLSDGWFVPIARVHSNYPFYYDKEYVLHGRVTDIFPEQPGELFLFINEAVLGLPCCYDYFYRDNRGNAKVTITAPGRSALHGDMQKARP